MKNYQIKQVGRHWYVAFWFDADDCEALAACLPSDDGWVRDLLKAADELRAKEKAT